MNRQLSTWNVGRGTPAKAFEMMKQRQLRTHAEEGIEVSLLLHEDIIKIPPTEYSITRQFRSHAHKLRQWLLGRQESSGLSVLHI
ncbi:golgin subfamily B member 1 [Ixodes scapularis]